MYGPSHVCTGAAMVWYDTTANERAFVEARGSRGNVSWEVDSAGGVQ